ncbi:unnamed protein product [Anisakis simplex]|uniref:Uncharacterized protein n=1 Tax=Anisakis simplex TaxID=6269 RepID=A0A3P6P235_ANISI|nr:unnamed protein product [Anisakis simplex]
MMCEPIFTGNSGTAKWYRDGIEVANVTRSVTTLFDALVEVLSIT